ncbi:MAG TPA: Stp1/IreP family PP2C-type Ser/Thr phosphatase [Thermoanaerobaculia bacterium]|nr:Stp1/IreP family PP2C-type Ser/Thr phosphatase [Thermoanaerobaculia bacterium]
MSEQAASESVSPRQFIVRAVLRTDVGLVRSENQDFGTFTNAQEELESHPGGRLLIVADGMGGHRGGATASRLAAETVKAQFLGSETTDIPTALRESLTRANARIYAEAQANPELRGMGTTTSVLAVKGDHGWLAHVGDSRIYLVRKGEIQQLTDDHSLVATMVREGLLTSAEAETHPRRNVLQRSMGVAEDVEVDVRGPFDLQDGDTFILCSDGLHGLVKEPELREIAARPIEAAADEYLRKALERGAPDNVTVIVARVEESDGSGDATLVDRLDETQPLEPFDETQRETQKLPAIEEEQPRVIPGEPRVIPSEPRVIPSEPRVIPSAVEGPSPVRTVEGPSTSLGMTTAPRRRPALIWTLILILLTGGAAGAWYYWTHYYAIAKEPARSSPR